MSSDVNPLGSVPVYTGRMETVLQPEVVLERGGGIDDERDGEIEMRVKTRIVAWVILCFSGAGMWAQPFQGPPPRQRSGGMRGWPGGKWWDNPEMVKKLVLTAEQQRKMDDVFQQSKLKLIDLEAALQKEEVILEGLMQGPQLDDSKILPSVDRIAQDRAELEKADARFLLGIRHVLTPEQWTQLQAERSSGPPPGRPGGNGRRGGGPPARPPQE